MKHKNHQQAFAFTRWGGKRRGAGRKPRGERAGVSHRKRPKLGRSHPVLVTLRVRAQMPNLRERRTHELIRAAFIAGSERDDFQVVEYSVQSNHMHFIVEASDAAALSSGMNGLVTRLARGLNKLWKRCGQVFPDRYHARALTTPRAVRTALVYVLQNARKHGSLAVAAFDAFSSASTFDGWSRSAASDNASVSKVAQSTWSVPGVLRRARTWLLNVGWRKHGLIELGEVPAAG